MVLGGIGGRAIQLESVLTLNVDRFTKGLKSAGSGIDKFSKGLKNHRTEFAAVTAAVTGIGVASVKFASDLTEATNKARVTFGDSADVVSDFAKTSANSLGISARAANEYAATLGIIIQGSGATQAASAGMSVELVKLAADLASFNNIPIDVALEKIRAGLVGETEPLRTVGVLLSEAAVKTEAYSSGIAAQGQKLTDQQKVQARYNIILAQTQKQQGDFERTSGDLANALRRLQANTEDAAASLGEQLIPAATSAVGVFNDLVMGFNNTSTQFQSMVIATGAVTGGLAALGLAIPPVVTGIRALTTATTFLAAHPLVALVGILGAVATAATVINGLHKTAEEAERVKKTFAELEPEINNLRASAARMGIALSEQDASLQILEKRFGDVTDAVDLFALRGDVARMSVERLKVGSGEAARIEIELAKATKLLNEEEEKRRQGLDLLTEYINKYNIDLEEAQRLVNQFGITGSEAIDVLEKAYIRHAEATAGAEKSMYGLVDATAEYGAQSVRTAKTVSKSLGAIVQANDDALADIEGANRTAASYVEGDWTRVFNTEMTQLAELTAFRLRMNDAYVIDEDQTTEAIKAQADERQKYMIARSEEEAATLIAQRDMYYESLRKQRWADVEDAIAATKAELEARAALIAAFTPGGGGFSHGGFGSDPNMLHLFPDLTNTELLEVAPQLQFLKDYMDSNAGSFGGPAGRSFGVPIINIETSDPAPVVSAGYVSGSAAGMIPAAPDTSSREAGF